MTFLKTGLLLAGTALSLSGCGLIQLATQGAEVAAVAVDAAADAEELVNLANTNSALTTTTATLEGTATYTGQGGVQGVDGSTRYTIGGEMMLAADFDASTISGTISSMKASDLTDAEYEELQGLAGASSVADLQRAFELASRIQEVDGEFSFDGSVTGANVALDSSGSVEYDGSTFAVDGGVDGEIKGDSGQGLSLEEGTGFAFTKDGTALTSAGIRGELSTE